MKGMISFCQLRVKSSNLESLWTICVPSSCLILIIPYFLLRGYKNGVMVNASDRRLMLWILQSPPTTKLDGCTPEPVKSRKIG